MIQSQIDGVKIVPKTRLGEASTGQVFHMLRRKDPEFLEFGEIYFSKFPSMLIKAWKQHLRMTLNYFLLVGETQLVLFDDREGSSTRGTYLEILLSESEPKLVVIPPGIWNGFQGLSSGFSLLANCATEPHDPNEIIRRNFDDPFFSYSWQK